MLFAPVTKIFWKTKFLMKSNASVIIERWGSLIVLIVPPVSPLIAILFVRLQEVAVSSWKELPASRLMLVLSWLWTM